MNCRYGVRTIMILGMVGASCLAQVPERGFWSSKPADTWEQALASGNGTMGALVMGQPLDETIILSHARLYLPLCKPLPPVDTASRLTEIRRLFADGEYQRAADLVVEQSRKEDYGNKRWTDPFIPACDLKVAAPAQGEVKDYRRTVDFRTGVATVQWEDERGAFERRLFVSRPDNVVALSIKGPADWKIELARRPTEGQGGWWPAAIFKDGIEDTAIVHGGKWLTYRSSFLRSWPGCLPGYAVTARVVRKPGEVLILARVTMGLEDAKKELAGVPADFDRLLAWHAKVHGGMFDRCRLDLGGRADRGLSSEELIARSRAGAVPPALLEKLFDAGRYAVISSSGELFPNLQGIWTGTWSPPWSADFTLNGNVQSAIAADLSANMAECLLPYFSYLEEQMPQYRDNARRLYGCRGIHVPSRASTHGWNNHFDATWPMTFWTAGAGWAAQFFYEYWLYTGDREFLEKRALPFMREAALFYEDFLVEGSDGKFLFSPSYSPENNPANNRSQACINAAMDIAVARELLTNLAACDDNPRWRAMLAKLPGYEVNRDGALKEWVTPLLEDNYAHRHCSHLYALYAGLPDEIATNAPLRKAFQVAAEKRMEIRRRENGGEMAFGLVQLGQAATSLRDGAMSGEVIEWLARNYWNSNLVSTHNPGALFNTDICGGLPAVILKALLDSGPGWIELLPALPPQWPTGTIEGARCRGRIEVRRLAWSPGQVAVTLKSDVEQKLELRVRGARQGVSLPAGVATEFTIRN